MHKRPNLVRFLVVGDTMLGRLIDQFFPQHNVDEHTRDADYWRRARPLAWQERRENPYTYVWGNTLDTFNWADLRLINLETSITTNPHKDQKAFNYRMHPSNTKALTSAKIDYCSLANNHILDYQEQGMYDTLEALNKANIKYAGVGKNLEEAWKPAVLDITKDKKYKIACFSISDHYERWAATSNKAGLNFLDIANLQQKDYEQVKSRFAENFKNNNFDMIIVSIHWGPNYQWEPPQKFKDFAHFLIDDCKVDLICGHSAHHIQGIEIYKGKPVLYGCGDFVDDYAIDDEYRNDLGFMYKLSYDFDLKKWVEIELVPTKIKEFAVSTTVGATDVTWLKKKVKELSAKHGAVFEDTGDKLLVKSKA